MTIIGERSVGYPNLAGLVNPVKDNLTTIATITPCARPLILIY